MKPCRKCGHNYVGRQCPECKKKSNAKYKKNLPRQVGVYEGKPCAHGHGVLRYKAGGACVTCSRESSKSRWRDTDEEWKKQRREKYATPEGRKDRRARSLMKNYGMTIEQYDEMVKAQGGACAICQGEPSGSAGRFHVDHDHATGKVRALLCHTCNVGLGSFKDSPDLLRIAGDYLEKHR